ncbi:MAG: hypothetical protein WAZ12_03900 [Candidatus Absconditicoccaceae bacterium]
MKNLIKILLLSMLLLVPIIGVNAQEDFPYDVDMTNTTNSDNLDIGNIIKTDAIQPSNGVLNKLYGLFGLQGPTYTQGDNKAEYYIKMVLNMVLGLVSFVSLILIIYSFYLIFFIKQEEGVAKARKMLIGVFIALVIMGLSWLIVSLIFDIYKTKI